MEAAGEAMSQPLSWWKEYYASLLWQGVPDDLDEIKAILDHLIAEAQRPFNVSQAKEIA